MHRSCVDPALDVLKRVLDLPQYAAKLQTPIQAMEMDLKFFKMFFWGLAYLEDSSEDDWRLRGSWSTMMAKFMQTAEDFAMRLEYAERKITGWEALSGPLRRLITQYKAQVKEICTLLLKGDFAYRVCQSEKDAVVDYGEDTLCFIHFVLQNVRALDLDSDLIEKRLGLFEMFALVAKDSLDVAVAAKVASHVQAWAIQVSCLTCLYWVDIDDDAEDAEDTRGAMFTDLMGRYMPYTPEVISMYLELLKGSRYYDFQSRVITLLLVAYVDFLLENLVSIGENDVELLRQGMVFLLSFVMDPIKEDSEKRKLILAQIYDILSEVPLVICTPQTNLLGFLEVFDRVKIQVRKLCVLKPLEFPFNSAKTDAVGFLDCFLDNLKKMLEGKVDFLPFLKHQVEMVYEKVTLIALLLRKMELQSEHERLNYLWTRVVDVVYYAEYGTKMCPMTSRSIWYGIICLPDIIQDITFVMSQDFEIEHDRMYRIERLPAEMEQKQVTEETIKPLLREMRDSQSFPSQKCPPPSQKPLHNIFSATLMSTMERGYENLPDHLKPCALYFVAFGRGENICVKKLKLLWIAEGFVKENGKQSSDVLAKEYLDSLVYREIVVGVERSSRGWIKSCRVHDDRLYDLYSEKVKHNKFLVHKHTISSTLTYNFHHRLCISKSGTFAIPESFPYRKELPTSQIHSLLWHSYDSEDKYNLSLFLSRFRVLTVLDLETVYLTGFPEVILYNIYLRYLALWGDIKDIPLSIGDLWNLETIIMRSRYAVRIPDILWEMESMKFVYVHRICLNSKDLWPNKPPLVASCNIEILREIILKYDSKTKEFLRRLSRLRKLKSGCDVEVIHPMWFSMFGSLLELESLHLYYAGGGGFLSNRKLPTLDFPNNLRKLTVASFKLPWSVMSTIGRLPNLEVLKLLCAACVGTTWYLADEEFSKLTYLKLYKMDVETIDDSACENPFPCLKKLFLLNCWKLAEIPSSFGGICILDTIDISSSHPKVSDSVWKILEQQRRMGNETLVVYGLKLTPHLDNTEVANAWGQQTAMRRKQHGSYSGKSRETYAYQTQNDNDDGEAVLEKKNQVFPSSIVGEVAYALGQWTSMPRK